MNSYNYQKDLQAIIARYVAGKASAEEILFVERYYAYLDKNESPETFLESENFDAILNKIATPQPDRKFPIYRYAAAAVLFLAFISSAIFYVIQNSSGVSPNLMVQNKTLDVLPGEDKAVLTLADGKKVVLDEKTGKDISVRNGLKISKAVNGQLVYTIIDQHQFRNNEIGVNTIETPRGGQYQIILPDGSKVWLNAASSLTYPELFVGKDRRVKLTGEAYFEVAKNKKLPFVVNTASQDVEVLGTHFNINSYMDDQMVKTTLLEGSVKVSNNKSFQILKPGEQSIAGIQRNSPIRLVHAVDTDDETAWKNGQFRFNNAGLRNILNQLERWYDIKIDYANVPQKRYNGMVPRKANLSQVLNMLELTGNIKFKIEEGRKLKVIQQ